MRERTSTKHGRHGQKSSIAGVDADPDVDSRILFLTLADMIFTVYCHSAGGDAAAALSDTALYTTSIEFTTGRHFNGPWRSLRSLNAAV